MFTASKDITAQIASLSGVDAPGQGLSQVLAQQGGGQAFVARAVSAGMIEPERAESLREVITELVEQENTRKWSIARDVYLRTVQRWWSLIGHRLAEHMKPGRTDALALGRDQMQALLSRLAIQAVRVDSQGLADLQRAWVLHQPFHNLDLLAASCTGGGSLSPEAAIQRCIDGLGGPCHVHALGFASLLQALGFDAELCGATIGHPDDHLLVRVSVEGRIWLCDVGNGQPYLEPFPLDQPHVQQHLGWQVRSTPCEAGLLIERSSPDSPDWRQVYRADAEPRSWSHFAATIDRHHSQPGFGPFLTGLRAVRIGSARMVTLRDSVLTTYRPGGYERTECADDRIAALLADGFGLADLRVDDALAAWRQCREGA